MSTSAAVVRDGDAHAQHASLATGAVEASARQPVTAGDIEQAKRRAAERAVQDHFDPRAKYVGIGSGTTILYVVEAIKQRIQSEGLRLDEILFVPTGYQSRQVILNAGLTPLLYDSLPDNVMLDVAFDGADEVDEDFNCVKGGGACLFQEKLVATRARKFICVADYRKNKVRLLTGWPAIPIEVAPIAAHSVLQALRSLGSSAPLVRQHNLAKAGPVKTDQDFYIIDAPFPPLLIARHTSEAPLDCSRDGNWQVETLAEKIKDIPGVLEVGLFYGTNGYQAHGKGAVAGGQKPVAVYFGMTDGQVEVREAHAGL